MLKIMFDSINECIDYYKSKILTKGIHRFIKYLNSDTLELNNVYFSIKCPRDCDKILYNGIFSMKNFLGIPDILTQFSKCVNILKNDLNSRQAIIYYGNSREKNPACYFAFHFIVIKSKLQLNVFVRSCDLINKLKDDLSLYMNLLLRMSKEINVTPGQINVFISSLHIYDKEKSLNI
jgi:hypothetical protein